MLLAAGHNEALVEVPNPGKLCEGSPTSVLPNDSVHIARSARQIAVAVPSHVRIYAGIQRPRLRNLAYMSHVV